jgi:Lrp/AsnC family transcriptional regulator, leucine-responsive regulatory protein
VRLSAPAVGERIRKLEHAGVIVGYRAVIDPGSVGLGIAAFVAIAPQPRKPAAALVERLLAMPEVVELHAVAGTYAYVAKVRVIDTPALDAFLDRLFMLDGVERTETTMVLRTNAERPLHLPFGGTGGAA